MGQSDKQAPPVVGQRQCDQLHERSGLPTGLITIYVVDHARFENEEATIDPRAVTGWLFLKTQDASGIDIQGSVAPRRLDRRHRGLFSVAAVKGKLCRNVDIGYAIAISEAKRLIVEMIAHPPETPACHRVGSGVHKCHPPRLG